MASHRRSRLTRLQAALICSKAWRLRGRRPSLGVAVAVLVLATAFTEVRAQPVSPASPPASAPSTVPASDSEIADFFDQYLVSKSQELSIPGGAVIVYRDGHRVLAKGYGLADVQSERPVDLDRSLFRAASSSKMLTWLLAMKLVEEDSLDLDEDINAYLDFEIPAAFDQPITTRHLLTHTAGFPEHFHGLFDRDQSVPLGERLRRNVPERVYAPGTTVAYSNYAAALTGYLVERLRGEPWEQAVRKSIFEPAGMEDSTVAQPVPLAMAPHLVSNYRYRDPRPGPFRTALAPVGSLSATAADMGRFVAMLAERGRGAKGRVIAPATLERMMTLQMPLAPGLPDGLGLGFLVGEYRGIRYAGHAGNMSGTLSTDFEILPDHGLAWYWVLTSQGPGERARRVRTELLHGVIDRFVAPSTSPIPSSPPSSAVLSSAPDVAGSYLSTRRIHSGPLMFSGLMNRTHATAQSDGSLTIHSSGQTTRWLPAARDRFVHEDTGIPLVAVRGGGGKVERIASAALYPVAVFERRSAWASLVPLLAVVALAPILLALIAQPLLWLGRRRRRSRPATDTGSEVARPEWIGRRQRAARISYWMIVATVAAWGAMGLAIAIDFAFLFERPAALRVLLGGLAILTPVFAFTLFWDALVAWRDPERGLLHRVGSAGLAMGAMALAILLYALEVIDFSTRW